MRRIPLQLFNKQREIKLDQDDVLGFIKGVNHIWNEIQPLIEAHFENMEQDYRGNKEQASIRSYKALKEMGFLE